jgi:serine/threonine-protein kinase PknK
MSSKRPVAPPPPIPGFTYVSLLGSGGFSDVYLYEQDRPRRKVAVKVLLSDLKTEGARRRFESEANLMAQLSSHPYIVTIFEAEVTEDGHSYLAMEYCSRPSLDVRYRRQRFSVDEVLAVGIQVASAVETAHRAGIAHRDIKPANILVTDYNRPALTDFGISGTLGSDADEDAGMSIPWSPPEQFRDGQVDGVMVDVWALGATLYTLLAGRSPFVLPGADNSQRELISRITSSPVPRLGRADVPESLELALSTAMAKSAASRYSSAHAFALALQRIQAELNLSVTPFEVLEEAHAEESHPDDGFAETRVRNIASVDPDQTGNAPTFPARTRPANPAAFTPILPSAPPSGPVPGPATAPSGPVPGPGGRPDQHDDWVQGTMLRGSLAAAPQATAPQAGARTIRDDSDLAATVNRPQAPVAAPAEAPADHSKRNLWLAVAGGAVLVVAVVVGLVLGSSRPEPVANPTEQVSKPPADALDNGRVPDVTNLVGVKGAAGKAKFTWTNPQPKPGDTFKWRVVDLGAEGGTYQATDQPMVEVALNPADKTCIQVMIVRSDGASSPQEAESIGCVK